MTTENFNSDIGLVFKGFVEQQYLVELKIQSRHYNAGGFVHGGVLATMLDTAMARSYWRAQTPDTMSSVTLEMKTNYLRPAKSGMLTAYGKLVNLTKRTAYVEGEVLDETGKLIAKASATLMLVE